MAGAMPGRADLMMPRPPRVAAGMPVRSSRMDASDSLTPLLIHHADVLVTMDPARRELRDAGLLSIDGRIEAVGSDAELEVALAAARASGRIGTRLRRIDARGCVVMPGLINTHHHMYQSLTRAVPAAQDADLFGWLKTLYPIWARYTPEMFVTAAEVSIAELKLINKEKVVKKANVRIKISRFKVNISISAEDSKI